MEMICKVRECAHLGDGVWEAEMEPTFLPFFGNPSVTGQSRTVLGLLKRPSESSEGILTFDVRDVRLLAQGTDSRVVIVQLSAVLRERDVASMISVRMEDMQNDSVGSDSDQKHKPPLPRMQRRGDNAFIAACRAERMPQRTVSLIEDLLREMREYSNDDLVEGNARKWVTKPNNFVAITIQNRKKDFAIHVRKTSVLQNLRHLDVRDDRPGYARFWLQDQDQLEDALVAVRASYGNS